MKSLCLRRRCVNFFKSVQNKRVEMKIMSGLKHWIFKRTAKYGVSSDRPEHYLDTNFHLLFLYFFLTSGGVAQVPVHDPKM